MTMFKLIDTRSLLAQVVMYIGDVYEIQMLLGIWGTSDWCSVDTVFILIEERALIEACRLLFNEIC